MSIRTGMFPPPNAGNTGGPLSYGQGGLPPAPNPFAPMPPMPLAGMPPPPPMGGMPPMMGGGMPPPPMGGMPPMAPSGPPMMGGLGSQAGGIQASNAPRRRSFGDYLENTMSSNQPRPPQAPQFDPRYSQAPQFAPRPDSRQARPLMNGGIVQGFDDGGSVVQGFDEDGLQQAGQPFAPFMVPSIYGSNYNTSYPSMGPIVDDRSSQFSLNPGFEDSVSDYNSSPIMDPIVDNLPYDAVSPPRLSESEMRREYRNQDKEERNILRDLEKVERDSLRDFDRQQRDFERQQRDAMLEARMLQKQQDRFLPNEFRKLAAQERAQRSMNTRITGDNYMLDNYPTAEEFVEAYVSKNPRAAEHAGTLAGGYNMAQKRNEGAEERYESKFGVPYQAYERSGSGLSDGPIGDSSLGRFATPYMDYYRQARSSPGGLRGFDFASNPFGISAPVFSSPVQSYQGGSSGLGIPDSPDFYGTQGYDDGGEVDVFGYEDGGPVVQGFDGGGGVLSSTEKQLIEKHGWSDAGNGKVFTTGGLLYDHEAGENFSDRLVSGLTADQRSNVATTQRMSGPDGRISRGSALQIQQNPNGKFGIVDDSGDVITFSDIYSGDSNADFAEKYSDYFDEKSPYSFTGLTYSDRDAAMNMLNKYGYLYGGDYVAPEIDRISQITGAESGAGSTVNAGGNFGNAGTYTASAGPVNTTEAIDYSQFNGDVGKFSNTGENFSLYGPKINIPAFNSQYISAPSGGLTTTNGPNMTAVSGIGSLNMPARPVDLNVLDWLSTPTYGTMYSGVEEMEDGGAVPRQTMIGDDPHMLAYINPEEAQLLKDLGGTGDPGPGGIPAYAPGFEGSSSMGGSQGGTSNYSSNSNSATDFIEKNSGDDDTDDNQSAANEAAAESMLSAGIGGVGGTNYNPTANDDDGPSDAEILAKYTNNETSGLDDYSDTIFNDSFDYSNLTVIPGGVADDLFNAQNTSTTSLYDNDGTLDAVVGYNTDSGNQNAGNNNVTTLTESQLNTAGSDNQGLTSSELLLAEQNDIAAQAASKAAADKKAAAAKEAASQAWFNSLTPPASSSPSLTPDEAAIIETESFNPNVSAQTFTPGLSTPLTSGVGPTGITSIAPVNRSQPVALAGSGSSDSLSANDIFGIIGTGDSNANILSLTPEDAVRAEIKSTFPGRPDFGSGLPFSTTAPGDDYTPTSSELAAQLAAQGLTNITPGTLSFEDQIAQYNNGNLSEANLDLRDIGRELQSGTLTVEDALGNGLGSVRPANAGLGRGSGFKSLEQLKAEISEAEGTSDEGGYDRLLDKGETGTFSGNKPLTEMTVAEAVAFGQSDDYRNYSRDVLGRGPDELPSTPMGKYQIVGNTLADLVERGLVDPNAMFDADTQEQIGSLLVNNRGYNDVLSGNITQAEFEKNLGNEFEGIQKDEDFSLSKVTNGQFNFGNNDDTETNVTVDRTGINQVIDDESQAQKIIADNELVSKNGKISAAKVTKAAIEAVKPGASDNEIAEIQTQLDASVPVQGFGKFMANIGKGLFLGLGADFVQGLIDKTEAERANIVKMHMDAIKNGATPQYDDDGKYTGYDAATAATFGQTVLASDDIFEFMPPSTEGGDFKVTQADIDEMNRINTMYEGDQDNLGQGIAAADTLSFNASTNGAAVDGGANARFQTLFEVQSKAAELDPGSASTENGFVTSDGQEYVVTPNGTVVKVENSGNPFFREKGATKIVGTGEGLLNSGLGTGTNVSTVFTGGDDTVTSGGDDTTTTDTDTDTGYTTDEDGNRICNEAGYVYDVSSDSCIPAVAVEEEEYTNTSFNIAPSRSFENVLKNIQTKAPTIAPISANIKPMAMGGMAGLNRTADNFLRALGG